MTKLAALLLALGSCTSSSPETTASPQCEAAAMHSDFAWIQTDVFDTSCTLGGCHAGTAANAGHMSLEDGKAYASLVNVPSQIQPGWTRVVPGDPATSYLLVALGHEAGPMPPDGYMPLSSPSLCPEQLDAIERWIAAGAAD